MKISLVGSIGLDRQIHQALALMMISLNQDVSPTFRSSFYNNDVKDFFQPSQHSLFSQTVSFQCSGVIPVNGLQL